MSREEEQRNKEIVTAFVKATNKLELDKLDDWVVEDYVEHQPIPGQPPGREGLKWAYRVFNEPFPDLEFDFADVIAEGDLVVGRGIGEAVNKGSFMGIPPTEQGRQMERDAALPDEGRPARRRLDQPRHARA